MEAAPASQPDPLRTPAVIVLCLFAASLAWGLVLLFAFEPDVQQDSATELVARSDDARAFLIADYAFIALYAIGSPLALWRFGAALEAGRPPLWIAAGALLLALCGVVDATENALLLSATASVSEGAVDAAHALMVPKLVLFGGGLVLAIVANVKALQVLRGGRA